MHDVKKFYSIKPTPSTPVYTDTGVGLEILLKYTLDFSNDTKKYLPTVLIPRYVCYIYDCY